MLHLLLIACVYVFGDGVVAETILLVYMALIHIPAAVMRLNPIQKLCMFTLIGLGLAGWSLADTDDLITPMNIRVVTMHCMLGLC